MFRAGSDSGWWHASVNFSEGSDMESHGLKVKGKVVLQNVWDFHLGMQNKKRRASVTTMFENYD